MVQNGSLSPVRMEGGTVIAFRFDGVAVRSVTRSKVRAMTVFSDRPALSWSAFISRHGPQLRRRLALTRSASSAMLPPSICRVIAMAGACGPG
jgi:hypothetical protein